MVGAVRHPLGASDFSSTLLQAQSSKAKVIALANAGGDTVTPRRRPSSASAGPPDERMAGAVDADHRRAFARPVDGAGYHLCDLVLVDPERRHARVRQALYGDARRPGSDHDPGRR